MALRQIDETVFLDLAEVVFMAKTEDTTTIILQMRGADKPILLDDSDDRLWPGLTYKPEPCVECGGSGGWDIFEAGMAGWKLCPYCNHELLNPDGSLKI